jgi:penicillin amidase
LIDDLRATFDAADPDAAVAARAGIERDYIRFAPPDPATIIESLAAIGNAVVWPATPKSPPVSPTDPSLAALIEASAAVRAATRVVRDHFAKQGDFGSNNWAVGPARSATSNAMLASDPHLGLGSPMTFWPVSIHVSSDDEAQNLNVGGIAFPGIPGIILGHNEHVAWGATVAVIDVSDAYRETLSADGSAVSFKGSEVPIETIVEEISDGKGGTISYEVKVVPHHGPILPTIVGNEVVPPDPALGALSVRWTGLGPSGEFVAVLRLMRASNVDDARAALDDFGTGGQNWMLADDRGDIAWTQHALVPYRSAAALSWDPATYSGQLPCFVLPGDGSAEWTGFWPDEQVPWAKNPPQGYLATANNDPVGGTLDNDPSNDTQPDGSSGYLSCAYADGHRQGRIQRRIEAYTGPLTLEDMSAIQGDHRSPLGARFTEPLLDAIANARQESQTPGSHPALSQIVSDPSYDADLVAVVEAALELWRDESNYAAASGVSPDDNTVLGLDQPEARAAQATLIFNAWLVSFGARVLGDELGRTGRPRGTGLYPRVLWHLLTADPPTLATYDAALGDSILFDDIDTPALETRQERMIVALVDALTWLSQNAGPVELWRWGQHHTVTFAPPAVLFGNLQIPKADDPFFAAGFPRHGDQYVVDASNFRTNREVGEDLAFSYGSGPTQRFVVEMTPEGPRAQNALPGGAVWDSESPHHADQAEAWRRNEVYDIPFALDAVLAAAESRTLITPH